MQRVTVYIDGFNLYYGLRDKNWQRYYWLDVHRLSEKLLLPNQVLVEVHYFTSKVDPASSHPGKFTRQGTFLEAIEMLQNVSIHYGYHLPKTLSCPTWWRVMADLRRENDRRQHRSRVAWRCPRQRI